MLWSVIRRPKSVMIALCALIFASSCDDNKIPRSGPPASEMQIARMLSGNSFDDHSNGQIYQAPNGILLSFSYLPGGPQVCKGTWRVDNSEEINLLTCRTVINGKIYVVENKEVRFQHHLSSAYGMDMIDENGVFAGFLPYDYGTSYGSSKHRGFPRWAEYYKLSRQLGL